MAKPCAIVTVLAIALCASMRSTYAAEAAPESPPQIVSPTQPAWAHWNDSALDRLLGIASKSSTTLQQAAARLGETRALTASARADLWPSVNATAGRQRSGLRKSDPLVESNISPRYTTQHELGASARWDIDLFGGQRAAIRGAAARQDSERLLFVQIRAQLAAEIALQYAFLRAGDRQQVIEEQLTQVLAEMRRIDATLVNVGLQSQADQLPIDAERVSREASLKDGVRARALALARMRTLTGADNQDLEDTLSSGGTVPNCRVPSMLTLPISMIADRPDVLAAEARWRASREDKVVLERARWPSLTLSGHGGWVNEGMGTLISATNIGSQLLASVGLRLLDFGRTRAAQDAAQARSDTAEAAYAETVLRATEAVDDSLANLARSGFVVERVVRAAAAARNAAQIADARLLAGLNSRRETLEAQRYSLERELETLAALQQKCEADVLLSLSITSAVRPQIAVDAHTQSSSEP